MARKVRSIRTAEFKAKVALAAVGSSQTTAQLAAVHGVHPIQITQWKKQLQAGAAGCFATGVKAGDTQATLVSDLYERIGRLDMELAWLKKNSPASAEVRRSLLEPGHASISLRRQCDLLGLPRSTAYYAPIPETADNLQLMREIDAVYVANPAYGSRTITAVLSNGGWSVNRKRVQRLMRLMNLAGVTPKRTTSKPTPGHRVFAYLLRNVAITHPDHVWSTDITYVPLRHGFVDLTAVIDWYSRYVLSWKLSNRLEGSFCLEALDAALARGQPEVFNTDQGTQFTATAFVNRLLDRSVAVSMDGRGRALDNVFVERLWRTVKYQELYLREYESVADVEEGLALYFEKYNHERPHQALDNLTPAKVYEWGAPVRAKKRIDRCDGGG
jgi:putative transposase